MTPEQPMDLSMATESACARMANALRSLFQQSPEARTIALALADYVREIAGSGGNAQSPEDCNASHAAAQEAEMPAPPAARLQSPVPCAVHPIVEPKPADLEAGERAVRARWANPEVSPRISGTASPSSTAFVLPKAPARPSLDLARTRRRLRQHLRALDWAINCSKHGFDDSAQAHRELCETGKREEIFFWEINRQVRTLSEQQFRDFKARYAAVDAALGLFLEEPAAHFRSAKAFRVVGAAVEALDSALAIVREEGFFDSDVEELFRLCENHPQFGPSLPPQRSALAEFDPKAFDRRINSVRTEIREEIAREKAPRHALKKFEYHLERMKRDPLSADSQSKSLCTALDAWLEAGKRLTDPKLLTLFHSLALVEDLPDGVRAHPTGARFVAILEHPSAAHGDAPDADDASTDPDDGDDASDDRRLTPEILAVREALRGKQIVLIGGDERPSRKDAIRRAFELAEVKWVATRPHETHDSLVPPIRHPDTALVILMIRWSSHSYGDMWEVCEQYGKPLVRLPGGYNPAMIAKAITEQAGRRLRIAG
jgi:hypothetical protein